MRATIDQEQSNSRGYFCLGLAVVTMSYSATLFAVKFFLL